MTTVYRDYGSMTNTFPNNEVNVHERRQIYQVTHNGEGKPLPYMNRSFISFTYGGKKIEDFDLIATISGDRLNHDAYASFEDTVTTYDNLDGQHYWATHYKANQMDFTLSTDGIDERQLDKFKHWFRAGISRELILAEHPNRAIMARVAQPPVLNLLPFEHDVEIIISSETYKTKTTLYKGDISLSLVMDEPYWYGVTNVLGKKTTVGGHERYEDLWDDVTTGQEVSIFSSQDALKILYEDGIPLGSMIARNMLLGNGAYASVEDQIISLIWSKLEDAEDFAEGQGARIEPDEDPPGTMGTIHGAIVDATNQGITTLSANTPAYFFYSGTAPSPTIISFTMTPTFNGYYINEPGNSYASTNAQKYNIFTIESLTSQSLQFTTPNIFTSYNKAQKIFETYISSSYNWEKVREVLRDNIRHAKVREYAISILNAAQSENSTSTNINVSASTLMDNMKKFLVGVGSTAEPVTFVFNSKTGEAIGTFSYYIDGSTLITDQVEDVGDMLRSNYIIIQDRNYPTNYGKIEAWTTEHKEYSHRIMHDVDGDLTNIQILYKNMYL